MPRSNDDLAGEPGEELGEGFKVEAPASRGKVLARLGEHLGESVGIASCPLDQAVELAGAAVGDLAGLAPRVGQGTVAILLGPGDGLAAVTPRRAASANAGATGTGGATRPSRTARIETPSPWRSARSCTARSIRSATWARPVVSTSSIECPARARVRASRRPPPGSCRPSGRRTGTRPGRGCGTARSPAL